MAKSLNELVLSYKPLDTDIAKVRIITTCYNYSPTPDLFCLCQHWKVDEAVELSQKRTEISPSGCMGAEGGPKRGPQLYAQQHRLSIAGPILIYKILTLAVLFVVGRCHMGGWGGGIIVWIFCFISSWPGGPSSCIS